MVLLRWGAACCAPTKEKSRTPERDVGKRGGVMTGHVVINQLRLACDRQRNFTRASVVSLGFSSRIQCPVSLSTTTVTSEATSFIC